MMKRYLISIVPDQEKIAPRKKDLNEGKRKHSWEPGENGRVLVFGECVSGSVITVVECEDPEDFTKDLLALAKEDETEIQELVLCPADCTWCPDPVVESLKGTHLRENE
jgi:hypothetical protein